MPGAGRARTRRPDRRQRRGSGAGTVWVNAAAVWSYGRFEDTPGPRQELRDAPGIEVCTVLPGAVDTPIYRHAANYVGHQIRPLPPVITTERVVAAVVRSVDRAKAEIVVGSVHHLGARAHRAIPRLYDRLVGPLVDQFVLRDIPAPPHNGNVFAPNSQSNAVDDA
jgi:hypothetical protein